MKHVEQSNMICEFYHIMDQWLTLYEEGRSISDILKEENCYRIAVYGMGVMGMHLIDSLKNSGVKVIYVLDEKSVEYCNGIVTKTLEDDLDVVDVVIYTNPCEKMDVIKKIKDKFSCKVISLADVVFSNLDMQ